MKENDYHYIVDGEEDIKNGRNSEVGLGLGFGFSNFAIGIMDFIWWQVGVFLEDGIPLFFF